MRIEQFKKCIRRLMVTFNQVNRSVEIMNGNSIQMRMFSGTVKRELKMELLWPYMLNAMKINSLKPQSSKRLLRIIRQLPTICWVSARTWDRVRLIEALISFTESRMFKVQIHGTLRDASTVSQPQKKCNQITISENQ